MSAASLAMSQQKGLSLPLMIFASLLAHAVAILFFLVAPTFFSSRKPEPFGGPSGSGGNVMWVTSAGIAAEGKPAERKLTQEEPAPALYIKKLTAEDDTPLPSKTEFSDDAKKKKADEPTAKGTLNQRERKKEGTFGKGKDTSADAGKSGTGGTARTGVGAFGMGEGGPGGYGTGTGIAFPFPWYIENVITKIELNWRKPYLSQEVQEYISVVYFVISRDGKVRSVQTEKSSGISILDRSCETAVLASAPFPPLPTHWTEPDLAFRLTFKYTP